MGSKSPYTKANELLKLAKKEKNAEIRKLRLKAAEKYYQADISTAVDQKPNFTRDILPLMLVYLLIIGTTSCVFIKLGTARGVLTIFGTFALAVLIMGVILRVRGDISENNFIIMIREGSKAILTLGRANRSSK